MDLSNLISKRALVIFSIFFSLLALDSFSQTTGTIDPNNLSNVKVDELSDEQVISLVKQGENAGLTVEQAQAMALKRGMSQSEAEKLKIRIAKLQDQNLIKRSQNINNIEVKRQSDSSLILRYNERSKDSGNAPKAIIYGQNFFREGNIKAFDKSSDAKAPDNYLIGIGDELGVSIFGYSYYNEVLKVDARGYISPNQVGPIFVKGLTYEKTKKLLKAKMSQYFDLNNNKLEVTLAYSRSITVNIVGEVLKPGSYTLPAINTAFNALILSGGPNDIGTLRSIQVRRNGKTVKTLDVYSFLIDPNSSQDFYLEDNDYIVVKSAERLVTIIGSIKRPSTYELSEKDQIFSLLKYAGGIADNAYTKKIQIKRKTDKEVKIIDLNLDSLIKINKDFPLVNGDLITIRASVNEILNSVSITGAVNFPGEYNYVEGLRISDVVKLAGGVKVESELRNAYIVRINKNQEKEYFRINLENVLNNVDDPQNIKILPLDQLNIYSSKTFANEFIVTIFGSVKLPAKYLYVPGMTIKDLILQAGGLNIDAENIRVEVSRLNYYSPDYVDGQDVKINIDKIILPESIFSTESTQFDFKLNPFDEVYIRSVPNFFGQQRIELKGEVRYPGIYPLLTKDEKLASVIKRAGGLTKYSFPEAATFYRPSLEGGYIALELNKILKTEGARYSFNLKDGDIINIPTVTDYVSIRGSSLDYLSIVNQNQINAPYTPNKRAKYYINNFGNGFTKESWRRKTYVIQPNAKINRTRNFVVFKVYPKVRKGSTIYVVDKPRKEKIDKSQREVFNWNKFIESSLVKLTGLATLFILFKQL